MMFRVDFGLYMVYNPSFSAQKGQKQMFEAAKRKQWLAGYTASLKNEYYMGDYCPYGEYDKGWKAAKRDKQDAADFAFDDIEDIVQA